MAILDKTIELIFGLLAPASNPFLFGADMNSNTETIKQVWLNEKAVSEMIGISISALQKQRFHRRGIPYSKIGRSVRYAEADVVTYMEKSRITFS